MKPQYADQRGINDGMHRYQGVGATIRNAANLGARYCAKPKSSSWSSSQWKGRRRRSLVAEPSSLVVATSTRVGKSTTICVQSILFPIQYPTIGRPESKPKCSTSVYTNAAAIFLLQMGQPVVEKYNRFQ